MRVLGIDYGERRIGIAVSDPTGTLARPVTTIEGHRHLREAVTRVLRAIADLERDAEPVERIVLGLPRRLDGSANDQTPRVEAFAAILEERGGRVVVLQDERLTSHEAATGNTSWLCAATNSGGASASLTARANCCRVPGR